MKSNLFKKIGAMVTTVAMIASLGTVAFADTATITIGQATCVDSDNDGIYEVTVPYTTSGVTGEVAVLGYVAKEGAGSEDYAAYNETTHTIVGIEQEAVVTTGTPSITFKVKNDADPDATEQSNINGKSFLYITLGAQGVDSIDTKTQTAVISLATEADDTIEVTTAAWAGATTAEVANGSDDDAKLAAAKAIIDKGEIKFDDTYEISVADLVAKNLITIARPTVDGNKYTYALSFTAGGTGAMSSEKEIVLGTVAAINVDVTITEKAAVVPDPNAGDITITKAEVTDYESGIYTVKVEYETENLKADAQVAMLSYIGKEGHEYDSNTGVEYAGNESTAQIIGIQQVTNGANNNTITYMVRDNTQDGLNVGGNIYLMVKLGAQGAATATDARAVKLEAPAVPVVKEAAYGKIAAFQVDADDIDTIKTALVGKTVDVYDSENAKVGTITVDQTMANTAVAGEYTANSATYTHNLTIMSGTVAPVGGVTSVTIPAAGIKVGFDVTVAPKIWTATVATASGNTTATWTTDEAVDADAVDAKVLEAVQAMTVTLTDDDAETNYTASASLAALAAENVTTGDSYPAEGGTMTYTVTIPTNIEFTSSAPNAPQAVNASFTYTVTIMVAQAAEWGVTDVDFGSINVTVTDAANIATAVADWFKGKTFKATGADNAAGTITLKADAAVTVEDVAPGTEGANTVKVTIPAAAIASTTNNAKIADNYNKAGVTVNVTVEEAGIYGDVYGKDGVPDKKVNGMDSIALAKALAGGYEGFDAILSNKYADVYDDGEKKVNGKDAIALNKHLAGGYPGYEMLPFVKE